MTLFFGVSIVAAVASGAAADTALIVRVCDDSPELRSIEMELGAALVDQGWQVRRVQDQRTVLHLCRGPVADDGLAAKLVRRGRKLFAKLDYAGAAKKLEQAISELEKPERFAADPGLFREAWFRLGWISLERQLEEASHECFLEILRLWPDWRPDPMTYPPHVVVAFETVRKRFEITARVAVAIETEPEGVHVQLDGGNDCTSPCRMSDLAPGKHYVSIDVPGFAPERRVIDLDRNPDQGIRIVLSLDERRPWAHAFKTRQTDALVNHLEAQGVGVAILLGELRGQPVAMIVGRTVDEIPIQLGDPRQAAANLMRKIRDGRADRKARFDPTRGHGPPPTSSDVGLTQRWWFWTGLAVVAAGTVVGALAYGNWRAGDITVVVTP